MSCLSEIAQPIICRISVDMINLNPVRNWTMNHLPNHTMGLSHLPAYVHRQSSVLDRIGITG